MTPSARAQWLDAIGVERWVQRVGAHDTLDAPVAVRDTAAADLPPPRLTVVSPALRDAEQAVLDKMLSAIALQPGDWALQSTDGAALSLPQDGRAVLVLAPVDHELAWSVACEAYTGVATVVAHPSRFTAEPHLKRPVWESLKQLESAIRGA
ncbi:MAG: hypothetical protein AAGA11_19225 [Pseudomonadota bacterium]